MNYQTTLTTTLKKSAQLTFRTEHVNHDITKLIQSITTNQAIIIIIIIIII